MPLFSCHAMAFLTVSSGLQFPEAERKSGQIFSNAFSTVAESRSSKDANMEA